jgi:hypothetical protein
LKDCVLGPQPEAKLAAVTTAPDYAANGAALALCLPLAAKQALSKGDFALDCVADQDTYTVNVLAQPKNGGCTLVHVGDAQ